MPRSTAFSFWEQHENAGMTIDPALMFQVVLFR